MEAQPPAPQIPEDPLVDVILPTQGRLTYLDEAIASVEAQTLGDWRLTISFSGHDLDAFRPHVARHLGPKTRLVASGASSAAQNHNRPFAAAGAKYVAVIHDDDIWEPTFLEEHVAALEEHVEALFAFARHRDIDEEGAVLGAPTLPLEPGLHQPAEVIPLLLLDNFVGMPPNVVLRRALLAAVGPFREDLHAAWDYDFWLRAAMRFPIVVVPGFGIRWRRHRTQTSVMTEIEWGEDHLRVLDDALALARRDLPGVDLGARPLRRRLSRVGVRLMLDLVQKGDSRRALAALRRALDANPAVIADPRVWVGLLLLPLGARGRAALARARAFVANRSLNLRLRA